MQSLQFDHLSYLAGDRRLFLVSGEVHYFRVPPEQWRDRLVKMRDAGGNCVATYVPWLIHEPVEGRFDFESAQFDVERFLDICAEEGLWAIVRPGPYQYSELAYDGLPGWLCEGYPEVRARNLAGEAFRVSSVSYLHPLFLEKARRWYDQVIPRLARRQTLHGGAVAAMQIDNELMGIHEWFGGLDYHSESMGIGREEGRWPAFLQRRYGGLPAVNEAYGLQVHSWAEILPITAVTTGVPEERRRIRDYQECYFSAIADYAEILTGWLREYGVQVPVVHNSPNPVANAEFREVVERLGEGFLLGSDHYYALNMDWDGNNPEPKYATKCFFSLEELRLFGVPPTVFELPGGSLSDFPPITAHDAECSYLLNIAYGMKGYNYYIFAGGYNPPGVGTTSEIYDYGAAVAPDGALRELYQPQQRLGRFLQENAWLAGATGVADCQVGLLWEYARSRQYGADTKGGITFANQDAWNLMSRGVLMTSFCAGITPCLADLTGSELPRTDLPLVVASGTAMPRAAQERLVQFLEAGGHLLLVPVLPSLDESYRPYTLLADYLGSPAMAPYRSMAPQLTAFGARNVFVNGGLFVTRTRPAGAESVAIEERWQAEIGWRLPLPGGGSATIFGMHWSQGKREHEAMLRNALRGMGWQPRVECSNPNIWSALRSDGTHTMLFLMNLFTAPMTAGVRYRDPVSDAWIDCGTHTLPGISVRAWRDGEMVWDDGKE